jgi:dUTP pyrophosphatase
MLKFTKTRDVKSPVRAHETDAGIDFFIPNDFEKVVLKPGDDVLIPSGIKVLVPRNFALIFKEKSGVATKKKLTIGACVVDSDYRGEVHLHLFNNGNADQELNPGDKITQGLLIPIALDTPEEISNEEYDKNETERASGGFGSTGN